MSLSDGPVAQPAGRPREGCAAEASWAIRIYVKPDGRGKARVRLERTWRSKTWRELIPEMHAIGEDAPANRWCPAGALRAGCGEG